MGTTVRKASIYVLLSGILLFVTVAGCQVIGGIHSWSTDPPPPAGQCNLPSTGDGLVRLVNAANVTSASGSTSTDFCFRQSGTSDWGRPIFRDGGQDTLCSGGLPYLQATAPFHVPVGSLDVKAIPAGQTCSAAATSEKDGIAIATAGSNPEAPLQVTTLLRYAGGTSAEAIAALQEEPGEVSGGSTSLRVVNALSGGQSINFGLPPLGETTLPATVAKPLFSAPIAPGSVPQAQTLTIGSVDTEGYLKVLNTTINYAASLANDKTDNAVVLLQLTATAVTASLFVVGDPSSKNLFPVRGLYCQDRFRDTKTSGGAPPGFDSTDDSDLELCTLTALPTLSFDTWDVSLNGEDAPFISSRLGLDASAGPIATAIAARSSTDVICLTEVDGAQTRSAILQAATQFGYSYEVESTVATQPDDPTEEDGGIPPAPTAAPCAPPVSATNVAKAYQCAAQKCAQTLEDGGVGGVDLTTNCLSQGCVLDLAGLYSASQTTTIETLDDICFNCAVLNMLDPTESIATGEVTCTQNVAPGFMFQGDTPILLLSKYPFNSTKAYYYPSTGLRRGILKAQVQFEDDLAVDVFCTQLASPQLDTSLPYVGYYGKDVTFADGGSENGWADEQALQAKRAASWIRQETQSDGVPGVLLGMFYSSLVSGGDEDAGAGDPDMVTSDQSPAVMQTLDSTYDGAFTRAEPTGYQRVCDTCPENAYTPGHVPLEFQSMFLVGFPAGQNWTASETLWATDETAVPLTSTQYEPAPSTGSGPLSSYYAHNWQLFRPALTRPAGDAGVGAGTNDAGRDAAP